ncbi:MAG: HEAT repeat domain-containing protein [Planctomycetes bacterium]|nr:HEAT repeat domain-containing protein [Planctomycetota bacterium]
MRPRRSAVPLVVVALVAAAGPVRAEDAPPRRPGGRTGDGFKFSPPDETPPPDAPPPATPPARRPDPAAPTSADPTDALVRRLATWPGQDGIKAAESLLLMGPDAVDPCLRAVARGDAAVRPGAAWVLGKVGSSVHVPAILTAAAERTSGSRLEVFFEAAYELDAALTKKWLFSYLTLDRPVFRARATEFLAGLVTPEDRPKIEGLLRSNSSRPAGVRVAGLELLAKTKAPDAADRLFAALGDAHPDVARRAAQLLADLEDPAVVARLNATARDGDARDRSYATLALVERTRRSRRNAIEPATVVALASRRGLLHPDRLVRGAAAVGLAFGGPEAADATVAPLLDREVVEVLIETAGGDHFQDYGSVIEPLFAALRRLAGVDLPSTAAPWAQWWIEARDTFKARRTLAGVSDADLPKSRVVFDAIDAEGRRRRATFVPEGADESAGAFALPVAAFRALLDGVEDAGVFTQPDDARVLTEEHLAVRVGVMNQERRLVLVPAGDDPRHAVLTARLEALEDQNLWQRYRDVDAAPDAAAWRREQAAAMEALDPAARRARLFAMVAASFDDLPSDDARLEAIGVLERDPAAVTDDEASSLLGWAAGARTFGAAEERTVSFVASLGRASLAEPLVEALARSTSTDAQRLLAEALSTAGPMRVRDAFADPRAGVRTAAASAAADLIAGPMGREPTTRARLAAVFGDGLRALLVDPEPLVRCKAAASLAVLGEPKMIETLEGIYREGNVATKVAVAQALGRIGGDTVQPTLVRILGETGASSAPVRAAALEAMAASKSPDAVRVLAFYMLDDSDVGVQQAAERALVGIGGEGALAALLDALEKGELDAAKKARVVHALAQLDGPVVREVLGRHLEDPEPRVVDEAAIGLALAREGVAVPYLLAILKRPEEPLRPRAVEALQDLTSLALLVTSYEAAAEQYEAWFRTHRQGNDRAWFRDAVARRGYDTTALAAYVRGENDLVAVPILLRTVRDDDPLLRRNSDLALRRISGTDPKERIDRATPREQARRVADRWSAWWARRQASAGGK